MGLSLSLSLSLSLITSEIIGDGDKVLGHFSGWWVTSEGHRSILKAKDGL